MSAFASSITAAVLILDEQTLLAMRTWLAGDLSGINVQTLRSALWAATAGFVLAIGLSPAQHAGAGRPNGAGACVSLLKTRLLALLAIALLCGAAVSIAGPIGFIGLVVPQLIRRLVSVDLRVMVPLARPCVARWFWLLADIAARTLFTPWELATGIMTALVGAPVFIFMASRMFK